MNKAHLYIIIGFSLFGCQKEIDFDLPQSEPKFILDAYVFPSPDFRFRDTILYTGSFELYVGRSTSVFSKDGPKLIDGTTLRLFENNIEIDSAISPAVYPNGNEGAKNENNYFIRHRFEPGNKYRLEAQNQELGLAWSEFTMPDSIPLISAEWDTLTNKVSFTFQDPPGSDYYFFAISSSDTAGFFSDYFTCFENTDPTVSIFRKDEFDSVLIHSPTSVGYYGCSGFFTDKGFDGKKRTIEVKLQQVYEGRLTEVSPVLNHITKDMYEHERTLAAYTQTKDNPFAEKVKIHCNIENGFGIFAGATPSTIEASKK